MTSTTSTLEPRGPRPTRRPVARAAGVELLGSMTGSGYRRPPALARRGDGQTVQLSPLLYCVLEAIDGQRDDEAIATLVSERTGRLVSADDVRYLVESKLRPLGVLQGVDGSEPSLRRSSPLLALRFRIVVSKPEITHRLTAPFTALFRPVVMAVMLIAFVASTGWLLLEHGLASPVRNALYSPGLLLTVFALTLLSAGFHELGHAAACRYAGATPGAMGVGLYLVWPAFYTDVSDSYRLPRRDRLRVDLGGLYFNAVFAVGTVALWALTGSDALLVLVPLQLLQMLRQLVPLVRFDGYHILADLTGVPDLFSRIKPILAGLVPFRPTPPEAQALKRWARVVVTAWVLTVVPILMLGLGLLVLALPRLAATAWDSLGVRWQVIQATWSDADLAGLALGIIAAAAVAVPVLSSSYLVARIARRTTRRVWRATEGRPPARAGAIVAGIVLAAFVATAWWPQGQYEPIRRHERGTLTEGVVQVVGVASGQPIAATIVPGPSARTGDTGPTAAPEEHGVAATDTAGAAVSAPAEVDTPAWPFSFTLPFGGPDDNQALAIATEDGTSVFDLALDLLFVTDGSDVDQANLAYALASCSDCSAVAVAVQLIVIVGGADTIVPENIAVAVNELCLRCVTYALAMQLIVTIDEPLDEANLAALQALWNELAALEGELEDLSAEEIEAKLDAIEAEVLDVLSEEIAATAGSAVAEDSSGDSPAADETATTTTEAPDQSLSATESTTTTTTGATDPTTTTTTAPDTTSTTVGG